jgi:methylthioribulose-1-phosphate dehydratase
VTPDAAAGMIIAAGARADRFGWVPGTAGNFSVRLDQATCAITVSGRHKGRLVPADVMVLGLDGTPRGPGTPSYETALHLALYARDAAIGAVVHGHSVAATVLSRLAGEAITLAGYELLKVLGASPEPDRAVRLPVFDNDQDIAGLAPRVMAGLGPLPAYVLRGHGVYAWGSTMDQAMDRLEAVEFILACVLAETNGRTA